MTTNENVQPLDEFVLEKAGALGPAQDWTLMCGAAIDALDMMIATGGTVPDLVQQTPLYFMNALRARMLLLVDVFEREQTRRTRTPRTPTRCGTRTCRPNWRNAHGRSATRPTLA